MQKEYSNIFAVYKESLSFETSTSKKERLKYYIFALRQVASFLTEERTLGLNADVSLNAKKAKIEEFEPSKNGILCTESVAKSAGLYPMPLIMSSGLRGLLGAWNLNRIVRGWIEGLNGLGCKMSRNDLLLKYDDDSWKWRAGDMAVSVRNDYTMGVMNGEEGFVREADGKRILVKWDYGEQVEYKANGGARAACAADYIAPAFARTVQKAQGAECDAACFIYEPAATPQISIEYYRKMLYTAVTRPVKRLMVIGTSGFMENALNKTDCILHNNKKIVWL